ncbi:unnamed protein product [Lampetra fluviatilis]
MEIARGQPTWKPLKPHRRQRATPPHIRWKERKGHDGILWKGSLGSALPPPRCVAIGPRCVTTHTAWGPPAPLALLNLLTLLALLALNLLALSLLDLRPTQFHGAPGGHRVPPFTQRSRCSCPAPAPPRPVPPHPTPPPESRRLHTVPEGNVDCHGRQIYGSSRREGDWFAGNSIAPPRPFKRSVRPAGWPTALPPRSVSERAPSPPTRENPGSAETGAPVGPAGYRQVTRRHDTAWRGDPCRCSGVFWRRRRSLERRERERESARGRRMSTRSFVVSSPRSGFTGSAEGLRGLTEVGTALRGDVGCRLQGLRLWHGDCGMLAVAQSGEGEGGGADFDDRQRGPEEAVRRVEATEPRCRRLPGAG